MSRWSVAGPSDYWLIASSPASKVKKKQQCTHSTANTYKMTTNTQDNYNNTYKTTTTIHTRQLQQYTQDNYNSTLNITTSIHTRQLQQYTQDNYNNTLNITTTIHTRQLQQYTQDNYSNTHGQPTTITQHNLKLASIHRRQIRIPHVGIYYKSISRCTVLWMSNAF